MGNHIACKDGCSSSSNEVDCNRQTNKEAGVVNICQSYAAKDASCSTCSLLCNSGHELAIRVEVFGKSATAFVNFRLKRSSKITIKGGFGNPYPYCIKWRLSEMKYELKLRKLSLVSDLIEVNHIFRVKHKRN